MTETFEFRVVEEFADQLFRPDEGKKLKAGGVRLVRIAGDDPRLPEVGRIQERLNREQDRSFFHGWDIIRTYSKADLETALLFQMKITSMFEPAGEECGTKYDASTACPRCGAGAKQFTPLFLQVNRIPKGKDISSTIAGEVVISRRMADALDRHGITGAEMLPIRSNPSSSAESPDWFQLQCSHASAEIAAPTHVGLEPFLDDEKDECRCAIGDLLGLNLLSEVSIKSDSRGDADIICSRQFIGVRRGLLRPERAILVSPKVRRLIESEKLKGVKIEVAHLV
ncbi:MAG: hypothetical protein QOJ45_286 [Verrucomicrobiota bacterium]|jgi:hypothetical protein